MHQKEMEEREEEGRNPYFLRILKLYSALLLQQAWQSVIPASFCCLKESSEGNESQRKTNEMLKCAWPKSKSTAAAGLPESMVENAQKLSKMPN